MPENAPLKVSDPSFGDDQFGSPAVKRVVILGHSGFIGSHLNNAFAHVFPVAEVVGQSIPSTDLTRPSDAWELTDLFNMETAVIMCAAKKRQFGDTIEAYDQNMQMAINTCRLLEKHPVKRFIYFSSTAVYGEDIHNVNITEDTPVCPTSFYGMAKYGAERLFTKVIEKQPESSLVILRPAAIYGPGDLGRSYGPAGFIHAALNNEPITLWGDGGELREFIYIEDVVNMIYRLINNSYDGVVNMISGQSHTFKEVLDIVSRLTSRELKVTSRDRTKTKVDNAFNNGRFMDVFGDFQFTGLEEGIQKTIEAEQR